MLSSRTITGGFATAAAGVALTFVGSGLMSEAHAAVSGTSVVAPYATADHSTATTCNSRTLPASCSASAAAANSGLVTVATAVDSGLGGLFPGAVRSNAVTDIGANVALPGTRPSTLVFHFRADRTHLASSGAGRSEVVVWATSDCAGCQGDEDTTYVTSNGDQTITLTLTPKTAGQTAELHFNVWSDSYLACDDFCVTPPTGTASSSASVTLERIEVRAS